MLLWPSITPTALARITGQWLLGLLQVVAAFGLRRVAREVAAQGAQPAVVAGTVA